MPLIIRSLDRGLQLERRSDQIVRSACLEEQYSKVVCRKSWPVVTDVA
jgi:hypothetical protein